MKVPRMTASAFLAVLALLLASGAWCAGKTPQSLMPELHEYDDPAVPVELKSGEKFVIILDSNATTGYSWRLVDPPDGDVVALLGSEYKAPETTRKGAGGKELWKFKTVGEGRAAISLEYVRPWEHNVPPAKEKTFTVIVH